jgi:hypothetical protein
MTSRVNPDRIVRGLPGLPTQVPFKRGDFFAYQPRFGLLIPSCGGDYTKYRATDIHH